MSLDLSAAVPAAPFIKAGPGGPHIAALRCEDCQAAFVKSHMACPACGSRRAFAPFRSGGAGRLTTFTVIARSYPGIPTPFVSAVVRLDDGVVLKGVLRNIAPDPAMLTVGMPVRLAFDAANGLSDKDGTPYFSYFFEPLGQD